MTETPELLPLGTAVKIEHDDGTYVLIARGFQKQDGGFLAGYKGVRHPHGAGSSAKEAVISQTQITEVLHRGYESPEDAAFAKKQLESAEAPPAKRAPLAEPDLTIDLSKPVNQAPAVASPQAQPTVGLAPGNPKDPFHELRSKGKRK